MSLVLDEEKLAAAIEPLVNRLVNRLQDELLPQLSALLAAAVKDSLDGLEISAGVVIGRKDSKP